MAGSGEDMVAATSHRAWCRLLAGVIGWAACTGLWAADPKGLYLMTRIMGGSLEMKTWYFQDGAFAVEPRVASAPFDFAQAERLAPGSTGKVITQTRHWTFVWTTGARRTGVHEPGRDAGGCFYWDAGLFCPVKAFEAGREVLDGVYSGSLGTSSVGSSRSYTFFPDGRYRMRSSASVGSTGPTVSMYGGASTQKEGRYRLQGQVIVLWPDGQTEIALTAFPLRAEP